ncbi:MAG TPA: M90 family metallopeptidase [Phycisphaerales bacterium]|nr:M90 family metallopeptidase [Phycisphaerales bacterium]
MLFRRRRRQRAARRPFPAAWLAILEGRFPYWARLLPAQRDELQRHIRVFLAEKAFEGCAGLEITDEMRVLIAAQACLLLLGREARYYPTVSTILVYPSAYIAQGRRVGPGGVVSEGGGARLGEMAVGVTSPLAAGPIVLAWDSVVAGARDMHDGRNVVLHEFAHALDAEAGGVDGAPLLADRSRYAAWARVLGAEYHRLIRDIQLQSPGVLDPYGATSPAEFFAVTTEAFFERPHALRARHPELYRQLADFYRQDPAGGEPEPRP